MKLFKSDPELSRQSAPSRLAIADMPAELFSIYERIFNRNARLYGIAAALGGDYPVSGNPTIEPPTDICGRIFYDMSNIRQLLDEMDAHIARLEKLYGIDPDDVPKDLTSIPVPSSEEPPPPPAA